MLVEVTCAIIEKDGRVLAVQRSAAMSLAHKWEFPGGKVEPGESYRDCLYREIIEELTVEVNIYDEIEGGSQSYPERTIQLIPFICEIAGGEIVLTEHNNAVWLEPADLPTLDWAPADIKVVENYLKYLEVKVR